MVLPLAVDLQQAHRHAFAADPELLHDPPARLVAGHDRDQQSVQAQVLEREPGEHDHRFRAVPVPGLLDIDPVPDVATLHRATLDRRQVDLTAEATVHEDPEPVTGPELSFPLPGRAPGGEGVEALRRVGLAGGEI